VEIPPRDPSLFARELLLNVDKLAEGGEIERVRGDGTLWTHAVKHWLELKGKNLGFRSIYTDRAGMSEFMLDFVWWEDKSDQSPGRARLACEMEWGNRRDPKHNVARVAEDFDKLLSFKALFKLMLFDSYDVEKIQTDVIAELDRYLQEFGDHRSDELYLVIDVAAKRHSAWECRISEDGPNSLLRFKPLLLTS